MQVEFKDAELEALANDDPVGVRYGAQLISRFRKVIQFIRAAGDERDFTSMRSLRFEKLKGDRSHQYSFRLWQQWRLVIELRKSDPKNVVVVVEIVDYH